MPETVPSTTPESTLPLLAPRRLRPAEIDCKWWKQGYCFHGSACYFRHDPKLIGVDKPKESKEQKEGEDGDGMSITASLILIKAYVTAGNPAVPSVSVQEQCVICLQIPSTFGLLVNCNHVFCLGMLSYALRVRIELLSATVRLCSARLSLSFSGIHKALFSEAAAGVLSNASIIHLRLLQRRALRAMPEKERVKRALQSRTVAEGSSILTYVL